MNKEVIILQYIKQKLEDAGFADKVNTSYQNITALDKNKARNVNKNDATLVYISTNYDQLSANDPNDKNALMTFEIVGVYRNKASSEEQDIMFQMMEFSDSMIKAICSFDVLSLEDSLNRKFVTGLVIVNNKAVLDSNYGLANNTIPFKISCEINFNTLGNY